MRIAVSGAHRTGKTTLIEELSRALPTYGVVDEPYHLLEAEGHDFAEMPSIEDFEAQLECSIQCIRESEDDQLFDRCPADLLAYLITHRDADERDIEAWLSRARGGMRRLDLIVFVPIEEPDRIILTDADEDDWRRRVDEQIREIVMEDRWDFGVDVIEVAGSVKERARQVLAVAARGSPPL